MKKNIFKFILLALIILIAKEMFMFIYLRYENKKELESYYNNESSFNYETKMIIEIPCIGLKTVVKKADKDFNNLDKSLVYYDSNNYNETIIILGHSGMGYGTYFNRLDEVSSKDTVYLLISNKKITYKLAEKKEISETNVNILNNDKKDTLLLITCVKGHNKKRLVLKLTLSNVQNLKK